MAACSCRAMAYRDLPQADHRDGGMLPAAAADRDPPPARGGLMD